MNGEKGFLLRHRYPMAIWLWQTALLTWAIIRQFTTWVVSSRWSHGLNTSLPDPSVVSLRHSTLSVSIFMYRLNWLPRSGVSSSWSCSCPQLWLCPCGIFPYYRRSRIYAQAYNYIVTVLFSTHANTHAHVHNGLN